MHKNPIILFLLSILTFVGYGQEKIPMQRVKIADVISMEIPDNFQLMELQEQRLKYVTSKAPLAVFSDPNRPVDISVNFSSAPWQGELDILRDFYKSNLYALYDSVTMVRDEISAIGNRNFIQMEFTSSVYAKQGGFRSQSAVSKYIFIQYTTYGDRVLVFSFSAPQRNMRYWRTIATDIMNSVRIK